MIELSELTEATWGMIQRTPSKRSGTAHAEWLRSGRRRRPYIYLTSSSDGGFRMLVEAAKSQIGRLVELKFAGLSVSEQILRVEYHGQRGWVVVSCGGPQHLPAFTQIVKEIAALALSNNADPVDAVNRVIGKWKSFWGKPAVEVLREEDQLGLLAELSILQRLIGQTSVANVRCWTGPAGRHDFESSAINLEVKATLRGRHSHVINGLDQLDVPPRKKLVLVSILASGASKGASLASIVLAIEKDLEGHPDHFEAFAELLVAAGYRREHEPFYASTTFEFNAEKWFEINKEFPKLSSRDLRGGLSSRISEVRYRLDLEGVAPMTQAGKLTLRSMKLSAR